MFIGSMGCVHTQQRIFTIKGWGSRSHTQSAMEKIGETNPKPKKIGQAINQTPALRPKYDKIRIQWVSNIPSESMLKKV